jgi:hypothetical protein
VGTLQQAAVHRALFFEELFMRRLLACLLMLMISAAVRGQETISSGIQLTPEVVDAYREYAIARQRLLQYRQVVLPIKQQTVADAIDQTRWELAVLDRRLRDSAPFLRVGEYSPVRTAVENDFLTRNLAAQRLRQLQDQGIALMRFSGETDELYQFDVLRAALRIREARAAAGY